MKNMKNNNYILIKRQITSKFKYGKTKKNFKKIKYFITLFIIILVLILLLIILILLKVKSKIFKTSKYFPKKEKVYLPLKNKTKPVIIVNYTQTIEIYLSSIPLKYEKEKQSERKLLTHLFSLKDISNAPDDPSNIELKLKLVDKMTKFTDGKNFTKIKEVFITKPMNFGNYMVLVNTIMYYCELFGIKNIYFDSAFNWYIKNNIISDKFNISIIEKTKINCTDKNIVCFDLKRGGIFFFFYYPSVIKPQIRIHILKNEIRNNLPYVKIEPNDLVIHIRSGNIFRDFHHFYSQPPLCFYKSILNNFTFNNIFLIAVSKENPTINYLLKEFPNITYKNNPIQVDMSYLINAYNLVGSVSSFLMTTIKLNDNLINYWDYDIYRRSEKFCHLNVEYYDFPRKFKIYQMKPSENYKNEMFVWSNDPKKFKLMIEEKCINNFTIIEPNI